MSDFVRVVAWGAIGGGLVAIGLGLIRLVYYREFMRRRKSDAK